ncbi:hypothetical protein GCM10027589_21110 [Actinocorallia lasiicapitis]
MQRRVLLATVLGLSASGLVAVAPSPATATTDTCDVKQWRDRVQGRPVKLHAGSRSGTYLWHDKRGFHVRVTHKRHDKRVYRGSLTSDKQFVNIKAVKLEKVDKLWLSIDKKTLYFQLNNHGLIDGFDFRLACGTTLTVADLKIGDRTLPKRQVYLGKWRQHPAHVPFTVRRKA